MMQTWLKLATLPFFTVALIACSTAVKVPLDDSAATGEGVGTTGTGSNAASSSLSAGTAFARNAINDPGSPLMQKIIYFDYDQNSVLPEYQAVINNHAKYLSAYPDVKVHLEGHADERGTREYNIALGEGRAKSVRQRMFLQGVGANQISIISYGEELPAALAHDEEAWALNRRVELVYEAQ